MAEKVEVSVDIEGNVLKCGKGLNVSECGYVAGAKICGKCGAMPIQVKMVPVDLEEKGMPGMHMMPDGTMMADEDMPSRKKKKTINPSAPLEDPDEDDDNDVTVMGRGLTGDEEDEEEKVYPMGRPMDEEDAMGDGMDEEDEDGMPIKKKKMVVEIEDDEEDDDDEEEMKMYGGTEDLDAARKRRLSSMGAKSAELGRNAYMCAIERKVYPGGTGVCDDCPGGCVAEKGMPGLLSVEGIAEKMFSGTVLDSGYSSDADMFVVDVQTKDGRSVEVFVDGTTAEVLGFHKLDDSAFEQKSALDSIMVIDLHEAAEIAVKSIQGDVVAVEPDIFEGFDAYAVEIEGLDGKSYDVFVSLDGEVLGYDKYEPEEAEAIESEAAEIALKRAFSDEARTQMAEQGKAMSDGSYPIESVMDLKNAISAFGRAKDKEAAKKHIMKRAKSLGQETLIPDNWVGGSGEKSGQLPQDIKSSLIEFELLEEEFKNTDPSN
jgi:uncharacterized membrane protein YkoI